jgi:hypothetical protein
MRRIPDWFHIVVSLDVYFKKSSIGFELPPFPLWKPHTHTHQRRGSEVGRTLEQLNQIITHASNRKAKSYKTNFTRVIDSAVQEISGDPDATKDEKTKREEIWRNIVHVTKAEKFIATKIQFDVLYEKLQNMYVIDYAEVVLVFERYKLEIDEALQTYGNNVSSRIISKMCLCIIFGLGCRKVECIDPVISFTSLTELYRTKQLDKNKKLYIGEKTNTSKDIVFDAQAYVAEQGFEVIRQEGKLKDPKTRSNRYLDAKAFKAGDKKSKKDLKKNKEDQENEQDQEKWLQGKSEVKNLVGKGSFRWTDCENNSLYTISRYAMCRPFW